MCQSSSPLGDNNCQPDRVLTCLAHADERSSPGRIPRSDCRPNDARRTDPGTRDSGGGAREFVTSGSKRTRPGRNRSSRDPKEHADHRGESHRTIVEASLRISEPRVQNPGVLSPFLIQTLGAHDSIVSERARCSSARRLSFPSLDAYGSSQSPSVQELLIDALRVHFLQRVLG